MFSTPSKFIFLYSKEKPSLLHQGKTFPSTSRKPKPKLIRNLRQIQKISTLTQITSSNLHSLSKELYLNPIKLSLRNLIIDSTSKPKLVHTSTLNQHQRCSRHNFLFNFTKIQTSVLIPIVMQQRKL